MSSHQATGFLSLTAVLCFVGCQSLPAIVPCPLPSMEQAAKVQDLVPLGTPRDEAVAKLKEAGIDGNFGTSNSIYYCDTWAQGDQERWHIDVKLLFDEQGKLYAFRPDPLGIATTSADAPGTATVAKPLKDFASAKQSGIVDPFAE